MTTDIEIFITSTGKKPFLNWQNALSREARSKVDARLARLRMGHFGDYKMLQNAKGVYELRIHFGPGYRIYFGKKGSKVIILICGGDKSSQTADIKKARMLWEEYGQSTKERGHGKDH